MKKNKQASDPDAIYTLYDLGCSAALLCVGFELQSVKKDNPHKSLFVFTRTNELEKAVDRYFANRLEVKARSFFDNIKALKSMLRSD